VTTLQRERTGRTPRTLGSRRLISVLVLVVAIALAAAFTPAARAARDDDHPPVVLVTSDCTASNFVCSAFLRALRRTGVRGRVISPDDREDPVGTLSLLARQGYKLVIVDILHADALATVAPRFPHTRFAVFDGSLALLGVHTSPRNVQAIVQQPRDAAYLAGWLAARLEQRRKGKDVIGAVGGVAVPPVQDFILGFSAGARAVDPGITVLVDYSNDFADPNKCAAIARSQIAQGAGVVFNVAGICGLGTLAAAKDAGIWGIGVDSDQSFLGPHILTSVIKEYDAGFVALLMQVRRGQVRMRGTTVLGLRAGGARLGRISPEVPASLRAEIARVRRRIIDGDLRISS
jgi:basic membrane protein A